MKHAESCVGPYQSSDPSKTSSLTASRDTNGLQVERWINCGVNFLAVIQAYASQTSSPFIHMILQATDLEYPPNIQGKTVTSRRVAYRAILRKTQVTRLANAELWTKAQDNGVLSTLPYIGRLLMMTF